MRRHEALRAVLWAVESGLRQRLPGPAEVKFEFGIRRPQGRPAYIADLG